MTNSNSLELLNDMLNYSTDMIFVINLNNGIVEYINQTVVDKTGYTLEEINEIGIESLRKPWHANVTFKMHLEELKKKESLTDYANLLTKSGLEFPIEVSAKFIDIQNTHYNLAIVRDITERVNAEKQLQELNKELESRVIQKTKDLRKNIALLGSYKLAIDESNIVSKSDLNGRITYVNDKFCEVTGYDVDEVLGKPHNIVRHEDTHSRVFKNLWKTIQAKKVWKGILKNRKKNGDYYWVDITILPILDDKGKIFEYMAIRHDITELVEQREMLQKVATLDSLTGFGNRYKLLKEIKALEKPSIALLNIDSFSEINDFYGHHFGDALIKKVADTIHALIKNHSTKQLFRLQADEFAILNISLRRNEFIKKIDDIIKSIENTTYNIGGEEVAVQITASISFEKGNLFITADMAMKSAKRKHNHLVVFNEKLDFNALYANNIKWTKKIRQAIQDDRLVPFFQPIVNNKTGKWEKYEALVRMIDEDGKVITPFFFLDIAKRTKYYETLTKVMIKKSFAAFKDSDKEFSINLTIKDILNTEIREYIFASLLSYNHIGKRVVFEIVESEGIEKYDRIVEFISNVKRYGSKIAIDDFGSGYSNFNYLLKLQADYIKLDGSLIKHMDTDQNARTLVETIVSFAKKLNMKTIAEYVENETILEIVNEIGINYSQGYLFSPPTQEPDFTK